MDIYYIYTGYKRVPLPTQVVSKISSFPKKWDDKNGAPIDLHIFGKISKATAPPMTSFQGKFIHQKRMMGKPAARPNQFDSTNHGFRLVAPPANQSMFK